MLLTKSLVRWLVSEGHCEPNGSDQYYKLNAAQLLTKGAVSDEQFKEICGRDVDEYDDTPAGRKSFFSDEIPPKEGHMSDETTPTAEKLFSGRSSIRVKSGSDQYCTKRYAAKNKFGQQVFDPIYKRECVTQSAESAAHAGVLLKHLASRAGLGVSLTEHERELLDDVCMKQTWAGQLNGEYSADIAGGKGIKALIDDSTSGGLEIAPIFFDADVTTFPLLNGELYPMVETQEVPRGRRIESGSISNPTLTWGNGDDSSIPLFTTTSMVAAIDTTIFPVTCAITIGRDFLSDSPVNVGQVLTQLIGERLSAELDKMVAIGNATTQPQGLTNASGLTTVTPGNTTSGPPTLADYMALMFSLGKQYRNAQNNVCFISNDTTYQRSRAIKIDTATLSTDQRSVLDPLMSNQGAFVNQYNTLGWPHKIQNDLPNGTAFIAALSKYRMYRRLGLDIRFEQAGQTLALANEVLLVARARYGGTLRDSNAAAKWTNGQS